MMRPRRFEKYARLLVVFLVLLSGAYVAAIALAFMRVSLSWPLSVSPDAAIMRFETWSMLEGRWPYRDFVSINLPFTYYINAIGMWLFGPGDLHFRFLDVTWQFVNALFIGLYAGRRSRIAGWLAFALSLNYCIVATPYGTFQRELLMTTFWVGAAWLADLALESIARGKSGASYLGGSVFLLALATFIKPFGVFIAICMLGYFVFRCMRQMDAPARNRELRALVFKCGIATIAALAVVFLPLFYFDMVPEFPDGWLRQISIYSARSETHNTHRSGLFALQPEFFLYELNLPLVVRGTDFEPEALTDIGHLTGFHVVIFVGWLLVERDDARRVSLMALLVGGFANYAFQGRGYSYHVLPIWFVAQIMAAIFVAGLLDARSLQRFGNRISAWSWKRTALLRYAAVFIAILFCFFFVRRQQLALRPYHGTGLDVVDSENRLRFQTPIAIGKTAAGLRAAGDEEVSISVIEFHSVAISAVVNHRLKFVGQLPVDYNLWGDDERTREDREAYLGALRDAQPDIVAYFVSQPLDQLRRERLRSWTEFWTFLDTNYHEPRLVDELDGRAYLIYLHKRHAPGILQFDL